MAERTPLADPWHRNILYYLYSCFSMKRTACEINPHQTQKPAWRRTVHDTERAPLRLSLFTGKWRHRGARAGTPRARSRAPVVWSRLDRGRSHRPVDPGTHKVTATGSLQSPQNKRVGFYFSDTKCFWHQAKKYGRKYWMSKKKKKQTKFWRPDVWPFSAPQVIKSPDHPESSIVRDGLPSL